MKLIIQDCSGDYIYTVFQHTTDITYLFTIVDKMLEVQYELYQGENKARCRKEWFINSV